MSRFPVVRANRILAVFALLALAWLALVSRVYLNASWSDGAWGYVIVPLGTPDRGDAVIFEPPEALGAAAPYLKTVLGLPGARIEVDAGGWVRLDGEAVGRAKSRALDGRALEPIPSQTIPPAHYYLHADHADSHDSRYAEIGLVPGERILGRAVALPDIPWLGLEGPLVKPQPGGPETAR